MKKDIFGVLLLDTKKLNKATFYQLLAESVVPIKAFIRANKGELVVISHLTQMEEKLALYDGIVHKDRKSAEADKLDKMDVKRDKALNLFLGVFHAHVHSDEPLVVEAYERLTQALDVDSHTTSLGYEAETDKIEALVKTLERSDMTAAVERLGLVGPLATLKAAQAAFMVVYRERLAEIKATKVGQSKLLRDELNHKYAILVGYIGAVATADANKPNYIGLREDLNAIRKRHALLLKHKRSNKQEEPEDTVSDVVETDTLTPSETD